MLYPLKTFRNSIRANWNLEVNYKPKPNQPSNLLPTRTSKIIAKISRERVRMSLVSMFSQANLYFTIWEGLKLECSCSANPHLRSVQKCDVAEALSFERFIGHHNYFRCLPKSVQLYYLTLQTCTSKTRVFLLLSGLHFAAELEQVATTKRARRCRRDVAGFSLFWFSFVLKMFFAILFIEITSTEFCSKSSLAQTFQLSTQEL